MDRKRLNVSSGCFGLGGGNGAAVEVAVVVVVDDDTHCCLPLVQNGLNFLDPPYIGHLQHGHTRKSARPPQSPHPEFSGYLVPFHPRTHPGLAASINPQQLVR